MSNPVLAGQLAPLLPIFPLHDLALDNPKSVSEIYQIIFLLKFHPHQKWLHHSPSSSLWVSKEFGTVSTCDQTQSKMQQKLKLSRTKTLHFLLLLPIPLQTQRPNCGDHNREVGLGPNEGKIDDVLGPSLVKQEQEEEELLIRSCPFECSHPASTDSTCAQQTNCRESVITDRLDMSNNRSAI